jgi:hypothetical protein
MENNRSPKSDYEKQLEFAGKGIRIIQIFEDEWQQHQDIVKSRIASILGQSTKTIYARKCTVRQVASKDASVFCEENHIMGRGRSNIRMGLYMDDELVSLMTFTNSNLSRKGQIWEINRFASKIDIRVVGAASRLFAAFVKENNPESVISYADNRWSTGALYEQLGFAKVSNGTPNYWYVKPNTGRIHRFSLRKTKADDQTLTEHENRMAQGYWRIWDCGSSKWVWNHPDTVS